MKSRSAFPKIASLKYVLTFGKYKGQTVEKVIQSDPSYILWMFDEKKAEISEEILKLAEDADTEEQFDDAMDGDRFWDIYNDD